MADQDSTNRGNGGNGGGDANLPQATTLAQYIKDLSVESPNAPQVFQWQSQPQLDVQFNINVDKVADDVHEVVLKIEVGARSDQGVHFLIDLSYGGLFGLRNVPEEAIAPFLLVEAPRLLFPFMRQIVAESSQQTGFPPLMLDPIDFGGAYMAQLQAQQDQVGGASKEVEGASKGGEGGSEESKGGSGKSKAEPPKDTSQG